MRLISALFTSTVLAMALLLAVTVLPPATPDGEGQQVASGPLAEPADSMTAARALADGSAPTGEALATALAQARLVGETTAQVRPDLAGLDWEMVGPTNIGGRLTDIAVAEDAVYAATANGGVWVTTDGGDTFEPAWPDDLTQSIGALAITGEGTLLAGTGELNPGGGSITFGGTGMYRSTDGGDSWTPVGLTDTGTFGRIVVAEDAVYAAAGGNLFVPGGQRGIYRSTDDGLTWELVLDVPNGTTGGADLAVDPVNPDRVFATLWDHLRTPADRIYGGVGSGLWVTTDGGDTWSPVTGVPGHGDAAVGRMGVAVSGTAPLQVTLNGATLGQQVYVSVIHTDGRPAEGSAGFYRSSDGGTTFTDISTPVFDTSQSSFGWWFGRIFVDPVNPLHVFVPGVQLLESLDGGLVWAADAVVHADQHIVTWDPFRPGVAYLGNDGGFYRSDANGTTGTWTKATYEPWTQLYTLDVARTAPDRIVAGLQDNGCVRSYGADRVGTVDGWQSYGCGDGLETLINPLNAENVFGCSQYGSCRRSTNGGDSTSAIGSTAGARRNWLTPLEFDPVDPQVMYYASERVNRSTNNGVSWTAISGDLTKGVKVDRDYPFGTISTVAPAASDADRLYVGTDDGLVWVTTDMGGTWTELVDDDLPGIYVTRITVDPTDADRALIAFSGFRSGDDAARVALTTDGGASWTNVSGNLPAAPVNDIVVDGTDVIVGTDVGVFITEDVTGGEWFRVGADLPSSPVMDLDLTGDLLTAATFGRSAWRVTLGS